MLEVDAGLDHVEQRELAVSALGAAGGEGKRALAFRRLVDHDQELAFVTLGIDLALPPRLRRLALLLGGGLCFLFAWRHGANVPVSCG